MAVDIRALPDIGERSPADVLELLGKPFRPDVVQTRKIAGRDVSYVSVGAVTERLNRAAGNWSFRIVSVSTESLPLVRKGVLVDVMVATVVGALEIPGLGVREGLGTAPCEGTEDASKSAASDALKRAASLFGVPLSGS